MPESSYAARDTILLTGNFDVQNCRRCNHVSGVGAAIAVILLLVRS